MNIILSRKSVIFDVDKKTEPVEVLPSELKVAKINEESFEVSFTNKGGRRYTRWHEKTIWLMDYITNFLEEDEALFALNVR